MRLLLVTVLAALTAGCGDHGHTDELITAGKNASNHLQSYYDHLTKTTLDWWEYQVAFNTIQDVTTTKELERAMNDRIVAIRARATMAGRLSEVYDAIIRVKSPTSTQPVITAARQLGDSLSGMPALPGVDLGSGLGRAADFLTGFQRDRDYKKANLALIQALKGMRDLFDREQETYNTMHRDGERTRHALLQSLARKQLVNTNPLLERLKLGVSWTASTDPATARSLALTIDAIAVQRLESHWACATEETGAMLHLPRASNNTNYAKPGLIAARASTSNGVSRQPMRTT
jgi:hypothetical protein